MTDLEYVKCALCGEREEELLMEAQNTHGSHLITDDKFNLVKCRNCGLIFINPRPKQNEIGRFYEIDYYTTGNRFKASIEKLITSYFNLRKKALIEKYKQSRKLIDIGCGAGDFLSSFPSNKWDLYGIEPNRVGFDLSSKKVEGKIFNNNLSNCKFQGDYFDVVTMWHAFEHVYDPNKELQEIKRILKEDGVFALAIPNIHSFGFKLGRKNWFHLDSPRHLYHYNSTTINNILNKNGFKVFRIDFPSVEYPLDLFHSLLNFFRKNKLVRTSLTSPLLIFSLLLKPIGSLFKSTETMIVFCRKGV